MHDLLGRETHRGTEAVLSFRPVRRLRPKGESIAGPLPRVSRGDHGDSEDLYEWGVILFYSIVVVFFFIFNELFWALKFEKMCETVWLI